MATTPLNALTTKGGPLEMTDGARDDFIARLGLFADTYAAARLRTDYVDGRVITINGRTANGDGGQGRFQVVPVGPYVDNGGTVLVAGTKALLRLFDEKIEVSWWGVLPGNADNAAELLAMRDALIVAGRHIHWKLHFPPSATPYKYSNNRWLMGLTNVTLDGPGAALQNIKTGTYSTWDHMPFPYHGNNPWCPIGDVNGGTGSWSYHTGYLIDTVTLGSRDVTLKTLGNVAAGGFRVGGMVLVYSFCQQGATGGASTGGFPLNPRYFEYRKVASISGAVVTLDQPLFKPHRDDYFEWTQSTGVVYGKPRIVNLSGFPLQDNAGVALVDGSVREYPEFVRINGLSFLRNPNSVPTDTNALFVFARRVEINGASVDGKVWPTLSEKWTGIDIRSTDYIEIDKTLEICTLERCSSGMSAESKKSINGGTGANHVRIINPDCREGYIGACAQESFVIEGGNVSTANTGLADSSGNSPIYLFGSYGGKFADIRGINAQRSANQSDIVMQTGLTNYQSYTVLAVSGNAIVITRSSPNTGGEVMENIVKTLRPGVQVLNATATALVGYVSHIVEGAVANTIEIYLTLTGTMPAVGSVIKFANFQTVMRNGKVFHADAGPITPTLNLPDNMTIAGGSYTFTWKNNFCPVTNNYWLYVGSTDGGAQYHSSGNLAATVKSRAVTGLPTSGPIYVTLFYRTPGGGSTDFTVKALLTGIA